MNPWAVLVATIAAFVFSAVWYGALGSTLATLHPAYASTESPSPVVMVAEVLRTLAVVVAVGVVLMLSDVSGVVPSLGVGLLLWVGFPLVILAGSVLHEKVPVKLAAIHVGDWLAKLLIISGLVGVWQ